MVQYSFLCKKNPFYSQGDNFTDKIGIVSLTRAINFSFSFVKRANTSQGCSQRVGRVGHGQPGFMGKWCKMHHWRHFFCCLAHLASKCYLQLCFQLIHYYAKLYHFTCIVLVRIKSIGVFYFSYWATVAKIVFNAAFCGSFVKRICRFLPRTKFKMAQKMITEKK